MTTTLIRPREPVNADRPSVWRNALGWVALAAVVVVALTVAMSGMNVEWFNGSPGYNASGGFNLKYRADEASGA